MKKLFIILLLLFASNVFAQELTIVRDENSKDSTVNWKRPPQNPAPFRYDIVVRFDSVDYKILGLDIRKFDTKEKAIQEAKYRLDIERRPAMASSHDYTKEQIKALQDFNNAQNYYNNAKNLVETTAVSEEEVKLKDYIANIRKAYLKCLELGIDVWSPCCQ